MGLGGVRRMSKTYVVIATRPVPLSCPVMTSPEYLDSRMPVGNAVQEDDGTIRIVLFRPIDNVEIELSPIKKRDA